MRSFILLISIVILISGFFLILACSPTAPFHEPDHTFPDPVDAVATNIILEVRNLYGSQVLDSLVVPSEGEFTVHIGDMVHPQADLEIYATADGFYTELYFCQNNQTIEVDLDKVPMSKDAMTGVIIGMQGWDHDHYVYEQTLVLTHIETSRSDTMMTDSQGRWGFQNALLGNYNLAFSTFNFYGYGLDSAVFEVVNNQGNDYQDLTYWDDVQADAPNIYLYPETTTDVSVTLSFPSGGGIILSDPPYNNGWNVNVTPEGLIDNQFDYLFYEAKLSMGLQYDYGWSLDGSNLETELRQMLSNYGFVGREIDDFIEFWIPKISGFEWYAICPQAFEQMSLLHITPQPDNVLRALFTIRPMDRKINMITPPEDLTFSRDGFTVVEWGVIDWQRPNTGR